MMHDRIDVLAGTLTTTSTPTGPTTTTATIPTHQQLDARRDASSEVTR